MVDLTPLAAAPRLLIEAALTPVQTDRFQPTGFPDLGAATYTLADGTEMILVESAQSMANRAETTCWDASAGTLVPALDGLPYIHVDIADGGEIIARTSSVLEAHRLNSPYVLEGKLGDRLFKDILLDAVGFRPNLPTDFARFVATVFKLDPCSLLHGLFMAQLDDPRLRFARVMSSFIEARGARAAQSGGVKNDRINPSADTSRGFGNVPFARTEYTAARIDAFLNLDLRQLRAFALPPEARRLLELLAVYKFQKLLRDNLRLRTACDLEVKEVRVTAPEGFVLPAIADLEAALGPAIAACKPLFADPPVTRLVFGKTEASGKVSKKAAKSKAEADK
ncbi:MAG: type I-U CRISPR-associated RAMP protein Csb1/Cas7u [Byssovorax sp.]